ncbi:hypothetical protein ILUMI_14415, partial [Ignelater luminosus]
RGLIEKNGYPFENHTVQTKDGYILEIHRIPHGRNSSGNTGPPVLFVPGYLCSSADWVNMGPENSLGFILADKGYDVWLANYRGTRWSRKHAWLNPDVDRKAYWSLGNHFQQIGEYDLPAFMNYILNVTKQEKLFYIGHSQGGSSYFALTSAKPEYNDKIRLSINLAPVAYCSHMTSFVNLFVIFKIPIAIYTALTQNYELLGYNFNTAKLGEIFCQDGAITQGLCVTLYYLFGGYSPDQINKTRLPVILTNTPAGSAIRQGQHAAQLITTGKFQKYDYGKVKNLEIYGQPTPPQYNLSKITAPVAIYVGDRDIYAKQEDTDKTASEISNLVVYRYIEGFSHLDVIWGIDAPSVIFNDILEQMGQY